MPFEKGAPRAAGAGRRKGVPNKETRSLRELMDACTPGTPAPVAMYLAGMRLLKKGEDVMDSGLCSAGIGAMGKAIQYAYPTLKAIEHSGHVASDLQLVINEKDPLEPGPLAPPA